MKHRTKAPSVMAAVKPDRRGAPARGANASKHYRAPCTRTERLAGDFEASLLSSIALTHGCSPFSLDEEALEAIHGGFVDLAARSEGVKDDPGFFDVFPALPRDVDLRIIRMVEMGFIDVDEGMEDGPGGEPFSISAKGWALVDKAKAARKEHAWGA
ncbi:MAG: hypothetical protein JW839_04555 [Candidatus Lokiarchaeota archaeon]|nr:hypothetical protein [Candidatus Lokiarchaeota archaeon]